MTTESRLLEIDGYFVEGDTKWFRLSNSNLLDTGATDAEIAFYSECSRLASRVEELEAIVRMVALYDERSPQKDKLPESVMKHVKEALHGTPTS